MKAVILALSLVGVASATQLNAQVPINRVPVSTTSRGTSIDGTWRVVGQDANRNTIYERRTYDSYGNIVVQRARRDANGNFTILSTQTVRSNGNNGDCQVSNGSVGDVILGRTGSANNCNYNGNRSADGVWRQVGQGRNNNSIYERRTVDARGNVVVQRGRRNSNGSFTILSTRTIGNNGNGNGRQNRDDNDDRYDRRSGDDDNRYDRSDRNDKDRWSHSEQGNRDRGKGHKGRD
jgi:hypothetical protein